MSDRRKIQPYHIWPAAYLAILFLCLGVLWGQLLFFSGFDPQGTSFVACWRAILAQAFP